MMTVRPQGRRDRRQDGVQTAPVAARLRQHWQELRVGDGLPRRDRLDPRKLAPLLGSVFLLDWTEAGVARFRIAGQECARLYGMELHGAPLGLLFEPQARAEVGRIIRAVCEMPCGVDMVLRSEGGVGRGVVTGRLMALPLLDALGARRFAIGSLEVTGDVGRAPRRFRVERCLQTPLRVE